MFDILVVLTALARVLQAVWGGKKGTSILEPLKMKMWRVLSCAQRPRSLPGFQSNSLQRQKGSPKTEHLDGNTDTCMDDI